MNYIKMAPLTGMVGYGGGGTGLTFNNIAAITWYGDRAIHARNSDTQEIQYWDITTPGNSSDFGDMHHDRSGSPAGVSGSGIGCFCGGYSSGSDRDYIDYVTIKTLGNASDFGDLVYNRRQASGCSDGTRGFIFSGRRDNPTDEERPLGIDYFALPTPGNASDFGDCILGRDYSSALNNETRAVYGLGTKTGSNSTAVRENLEYITMQTLGNASAFGKSEGNGAWRRSAMGDCCSDQGRGVMGGGVRTNGSNDYDAEEIDYITVDTLGDCQNFGQLTAGRAYLAKGNASNSTRGCFVAGLEGGNGNVIDYITFDTTGNATDFGDLNQGTGGSSICAQ